MAANCVNVFFFIFVNLLIVSACIIYITNRNEPLLICFGLLNVRTQKDSLREDKT